MRKYFTDIPICPNCFEPINDGVKLIKLDDYENILFCSSCGSYFKKNIIWENESFPLFNKINLNVIESAYMDWILNGVNGKFLITWPWDTVDFIPVLLSQYLYEHPSRKIVIFCNQEHFQQDLPEVLSISNILNSLFFINNSNEFDSDDELDVRDVFVKYNFNLIKSINEDLSNTFFECFHNRFSLIPCFFDIDYTFIESKDDINIKTFHNQLIFINELIFSRDIVNFINEIDPDLIIAMDIDSLYGQNRFKKHLPIYDLYKSNFNILFFSVDLTQRNFYKIGQEDYFLKNWNIIPHTWDYKEVFDKLYEIDDKRFSICSSNMSNAQSYKNEIEIDFICCEELAKIEDTFEIFHELFFYDNNIKRTLNDLLKTPLYIRGLYGDNRVLNRNITFEYLFSLVYNMDPQKWEILMDVFDEVYGFKSIRKNPIMTTLLESIGDLNAEDFVIIVHHYDVKGTKLILNDLLGENDILVTSFSNLNEDIKDKSIIHGISTLFPPTNYDINSSSLMKLDIICSPFNFNQFDIYRKNRFTENGIKPIHLLGDDEDAPTLLKDIIKDINIPDDYHYKINRAFKYGFNIDQNPFHMFRYSYLREGDEAILILNENDEGMFLKLKNIIYILDKNDNAGDYKVDEDYEKLIEKKLLISNFGYHSIGRIFFKFVINNGSDIILREDNFKWIGFKDLIEDMFLWVDCLNKIMEIEFENGSGSHDVAKSKVAAELSKLNLYARREVYIKNVWLDEPKPLETNFGNVLIYESERPKSKEDLIKIFDWISKNYDGFSFTKLDAKKSFAASTKLQNIRNKFIKTGSSSMGPSLNRLRNDFKEFLNDETKLFDKFNIKSSKKVKIKKNVSPFEIINDYEEYI